MGVVLAGFALAGAHNALAVARGGAGDGELAFTVTRNGAPIGSHVYHFDRQGRRVAAVGGGVVDPAGKGVVHQVVVLRGRVVLDQQRPTRLPAAEPGDDLVLVKSSSEALHGADALAIVTEWQEFRSPDFDTIKSELAHPVIFDGRNLYDPAFVKRFGLKYYAIGRGDSVC